MLHAKALALVVAYDIYKECCEGKMQEGKWRIKKLVSFYRFREKLACQMMEYSPTNRKYPGDEKFRVSTQQHKARRALQTSLSSSSNGTMTSNAGNLSKQDFDNNQKRLCGDLTPLYPHIEHCVPIPNKGHKVCVVCGEMAYHVCMECVGPDGNKGVALHVKAGGKHTANKTSTPCFFHYHNTSFFGLAKNDHCLIGKRKRDYSFPTEEEMIEHRKITKNILQPRVVPLPTAPKAKTPAPAVDAAAAQPQQQQQHAEWRNGEQYAPL